MDVFFLIWILSYAKKTQFPCEYVQAGQQKNNPIENINFSQKPDISALLKVR